jgi:hypothetical protein
MLRALAATLVVALAAAAGAAADHLDPGKRLAPADQRRARAMLLRAADFGPGTQVQQNAARPHTTCKGLDQSDLVLTGEARSSSFVDGPTIYLSSAAVYRTVADSRSGWRRSQTPPALACLRAMYRSEYAKQGLTLQSFRRHSFPRIAQDAIAFRALLTGEVQGTTVPIAIDLVVLRHTRAQVALAFASMSPPTRAEEARFARLTARRMAAAMRGT